MISRNLALRIMTGLPLAAAACWFIFAASERVFIAVSLLIGLIAYYEYGNALHFKKILLNRIVLFATQLAVFAIVWSILNQQPEFTIGLLIATLIMISVASFSTNARNQRIALWYILPIFWILGPLCLLYLLRFKIIGQYGSLFIFFIVLVTAFNDIFAFFGGKRFGKHLLAPVISPKKTIEGSVFGIVGGMIAGLILSYFWLNDLLPMWKSIPVIIVLVAASQAGDLVESKFKRFCGIKDSSNLIPGHGGLLDRIDAYLLALPTFIGLLYAFDIA
jgi:phosphatidate cytidylyltransferase